MASSLNIAQQVEGDLESQGFGIVEAIISAAILFFAIAISLSLYSFSTSNARRVEVAQKQSDAIDADIAVILALNEKYSCKTTALADCSSTESSSYPGEDEYLPPDYINSKSFQTSLANACADGFGDELATATNNISQTELNQIGVTRSAGRLKSTSNPNASGHLYRVSWKASENMVRSVVLYPTIAGWCP